MKKLLLCLCVAGGAVVACSSDDSSGSGSSGTVPNVDAGADTGAQVTVDAGGSDASTSSCTTTTCNGHGKCDDSSGTAKCTCDSGYAGATCTECAPGGQDKDGNKICAPACTPDTCGPHGKCDDSTGTAVCACDAGYMGASCATCAAGFQDNDKNGSCTASCSGSACNGHGTCADTSGSIVCTCDAGYSGPTCAVSPQCTPTTCNGHGTCADGSGTAVCTCDAGYAGAACAACATGFQDNDNDKTCKPSCTDTTCSGHGTCADTSGSTVCACATGYAGAACDTCATGFQDNDNDKTCKPACAASTCGAHGTCSDASGATVCTCAAGYSGAACDTCATGFQDNDNDKICKPACGPAVCSSKGTCSDASGTAVCTCNHGWAGSTCDSCAPGFTGTSCDTCVANKAGPNCDYDLLFGLNIPLSANWDVPTDVPYDYDNTLGLGAFTRVAYRLILGSEEVWAEMDAFTTQKDHLGIPVDWTFKQAVNNVTVISKAANTPSVSTPTTGGIEFWSSCYSQTGGNSSLYDYDDTPTSTDCYGSLQLSIGTNMVFSYNRWSSGGNSDMGFGNQPTGNPDWTFAQNSASFATRRLEVYIK